MNDLVERPYIWLWKKRLPDRRGQLFRVICRGALKEGSDK